MTEVDWLAAGVLVMPNSVVLIKKGGVVFATFSRRWEARACCLDQ